MADLPVARLLDPDRIAEAGAEWSQAAATTPWGGIVVGSARFVEYGVRAPLLLIPDLFRVDLQPLHETLSVSLRELSHNPTRWEANADTWDALRNTDATEPLEMRGSFDLPEMSLATQIRVVLVADGEMGGCYISARAAIGQRA